MNKNGKMLVSVIIDEKLHSLLNERIEYLQNQRPGTKVTVSDAVRHAIASTDFKSESSKKVE